MSGQHKVLQYTKNKFLEEKKAAEKVKKEKIKQDNRFKEMLSLAAGLGLSMALPIAGGAFAGNILDSKFHSSPKLTLSLIFAGLFIGVANIFTALRKLK